MNFIFGEVNIITEVVSFLLALMILIFMLRTKPRKTYIYNFNFYGIIVSLLAIIVNISIHCIANEYEHVSPELMTFLITVFYLLYGIILALIFIYVDLLSYRRHSQEKQWFSMVCLAFVIYLTVNGYLIFSGKMFQYSVDGVTFTKYLNFYILSGFVDCAWVVIATFTNKKYIPRNIYYFTLLFVPFDALLLFLQLVAPQVLFSSVTYVFPFTVFYILFHSNPTNEITGCRNEFSFQTKFMFLTNFKKHFYIIQIRFPQLQNFDDFYTNEGASYLIAERCRQIERTHPNVSLFSKNISSYMIIFNEKDERHAKEIIHSIAGIVNLPIIRDNVTYTYYYKMIAFHNSPEIPTIPKYHAFVNYLTKKMINSFKSECYIAKPEDYLSFENEYNVLETLRDIHTKFDLDDPRVLCYAQPIYSVSSKNFTSAEALMRLKIGDRIIYPDQFIPLAESNGYINSLTCIILNKVCKMVNLLDSTHRFDSISVNCTTTEFAESQLHHKLLQIINSNHINSSKIKLELTESTQLDDTKSLIFNMNNLISAGVSFYLDDFGTGYSNFSRIFTCPFSTIKFDKSMLYKSLDDEQMDEVMMSMVTIFKKKGYECLVEGVENEEHSKRCIERGFEYLQGYYYAKPSPIEQLANYFEKK